jgi:hypothetical protein
MPVSASFCLKSSGALVQIRLTLICSKTLHADSKQIKVLMTGATIFQDDMENDHTKHFQRANSDPVEGSRRVTVRRRSISLHPAMLYKQA